MSLEWINRENIAQSGGNEDLVKIATYKSRQSESLESQRIYKSAGPDEAPSSCGMKEAGKHANCIIYSYFQKTVGIWGTLQDEKGRKYNVLLTFIKRMKVTPENSIIIQVRGKRNNVTAYIKMTFDKYIHVQV